MLQILRVIDSGAIVELPGGRDAYVHRSELSIEVVDAVAEAVASGDAVDVMITATGPRSTSASIAAVERQKRGLPPMPPQRAQATGGGRGGGRGDASTRNGAGRGRGRSDSGSLSQGGRESAPAAHAAPAAAPAKRLVKRPVRPDIDSANESE
jgi:transcriptional accessory protein Tex/SPT6